MSFLNPKFSNQSLWQLNTFINLKEPITTKKKVYQKISSVFEQKI